MIRTVARQLERFTRSIFAFAVLVVGAVGLTLFASDAPAQAEPKFLPGFAELYPASAASQLNGCLLCHDTASPTEGNHRRNPYGQDWDRNDKNYRNVENLDSDGDGFTNLQEIQALSFPGDPASTPLTVTTTTTLPGTAPDGAALFAASCASCHGAGGGNLRNTALDLPSFTQVVSNGRGGSMPAFGGALSATQIEAIYAYLTGAAPPVVTTTTLPGTPIDALGLFNQTCSGCHGADGGNLVPTGLSASQLVGVITNGKSPSMPAFGTSLSGEQISALANFILNHSSTPTTAPSGSGSRSGASVYGSSCAGCHGASGGNLVGSTLTRSQMISVIGNGRAPSMPAFSTRLPAAEIAAVTDYIRSLTPPTTLAGTEPDAASLFMQNCSVCHGPHGEGGSGGAIAGTDLSRAAILQVVTAGRGSMPGFESRLSPTDLEALADFVVALGGSSSTGADPDGDGDGVLAAGAVDSTTTTTTEPKLTSVGPDVLRVAAEPEADPGPAHSGSPWIPAVPLVAVVGWVIFDAARSGQLPGWAKLRRAA